MFITRSTIVTLIIAGLLVVLAFLTREDDARGEEAAIGPRPLEVSQSFPANEVTRITLKRRGEQPLRFERREMNWVQVEPFMFPMDAFSVRQLARLVRDIEVVDSIEPDQLGEGLSAGTLGLDPPAATIEYAWAAEGDGEIDSLTLHLGRRGIAGRAYLRVDDDPAVLVTNQVLHERAVDMDDKEWRARPLFRGVSIDATSVERRNGESQLVLERDGRRWRMLEPAKTRLDLVALEEFFQALASAKLSGFIKDQPADIAAFGLAAPIGTLSVTMQRPVETPDGAITHEFDTQQLRLGSRIGGSTQDRFAMVDGRPVVFRLPASALLALFKQPTELMEPTGSGVAPADVKAVDIDGPGGRFLLERDIDKWIAPDYDGMEVPPAYVGQLLTNLCELRAPDVMQSPYPRDLHVATITLIGFDGRPLDTVRIARETEEHGRNWAFENGDNVLRIYPESLKLRLTPGDYGLASDGAAGPSPSP